MDVVDPVELLSSDASKVDRRKFELCKQVVVFLREKDMSQVEMAKKLGIETSTA